MEKRSSMIIIILFLFFVTLIHLLAVTSIQVRTIQREMDYYVYAQHWPGTKEVIDADSTEQTDKPTTSSSSSSSKGAKSKTENKQQSTSTTAGEQKTENKQQSTSTTAGEKKNPNTGLLRGSTEQTDKPTTSSSSSSSSKGEKPKTENKQQSTSTTAREQKNPRARWRIARLLKRGEPDQKKPTLKLDHVENFGIHGLWPQYFKGNPSYPVSCLKPDGGLPEAYEFSKIEHLYERLKKHWHSLASPYEDGHPVKSQNRFGQAGQLDNKAKDGIWEHEWEKHGTCSTFEQQREYFEKTLELRIPSNLENRLTWKNISNLLEALYEDEIKPDGSSYPIDRIRNAIQKKIHVMPIIECNDRTKHELYQVHICLTKENLELMDCIRDPVLKCQKGRDIIFPSFPKKDIDHTEL